MQFDTPAAGQHTITFRNGVKYIFQGPSDIKSVAGRTATLYQVKDPYGNQLTFSYTGSNLTGITDNVGAGRTVTIGYSGSLISAVSDWSGRSWSYGYDANGNLQSMTTPSPLSKTTTYTYHPGTHNLNEVILPDTRSGQQVKTAFKYYRNGKTFNYGNNLGNTETLDYDLYRKSTRVTDPRGFIREYEYDTNGLLTKLTEPDHAILQFENGTDGLRFKKYDGLGYATTYSYRNDHAVTGASDTFGNVTRETDPLTNTLQYSYGIYDQMATVKDKNGNIRIMAYYATTNPAIDAVQGKLQNVILNSLDGTVNVLLQSYTYYPNGTLKQLTEQIDPANSTKKRITTYYYDSTGLNLTSSITTGSGDSLQTDYTYDTLGRKKTATIWRRTSATDATLIPLTTAYDYDSLDRVIKVIDTLGNYLETIYDGNGKVYQVKGSFKKPDATFDTRIISTRQYDAADRLISEKDIYNNETLYAYDEAGNLIKTTDPNGHITLFEYDAMNRRTAIIDANGHRNEAVFDLAGRAIKDTNALGKSISTAYDVLGRPTTITDPLGYQTTIAYDANGNVTRMTDANANAGLQPKNSYNATLYKEYDELSRVKREVDALNGVTAYTYDLLGNITSITDAEVHTTYFDYDDLGRLSQVRDPLIETPTDKVIGFTYDEAGNVLTKTKRSGAHTVYTYDILNRMTAAQYTSAAGTSTETVIYDIYGNKQSVSNPAVTYSYEYDLRNRITKKTDSRVNKSLAYTYDKAGNVLTKTTYDGSITDYRYDSANKLVSLRNPDFLEVSYQYDGAGRLLNRILSNGAKTGYTWYDNGRLQTLTNTSANGTIINSATYTRDRLGNVTGQSDAGGATGFTYDALYRLTSAAYPGTANNQSFTYDKVGNRKTSNRAGATLAFLHDAGNRLKEIRQDSITGALLNSFDFDDDGNMVTKHDSAATVIQSFTLDPKGRTKTITTAGATRVTELDYDPFDYRIFKDDSHGNNLYLLEGEHLEGISSGGQWQAKYLRGAVIDEVVNGYQYDTNGTWTNYTFHHDALQSVTGLTAHEGSILETRQYGPFGETIATTGSSNNTLRYTGREADTDSGLFYYRARYMDPTTGRFISEDPKGFEAGVNFYSYAESNPINANDPFGLEVSLNLFPKNERIYDLAQKVNPIPGVFTVGVHSSPVRWEQPNGDLVKAKDAAQSLAQEIINSGKWEQGMPILILGCYSGACPSDAANPLKAQQYGNYLPLAQQVSNILQTPTGGATAYAWYQNDGSLPKVAPDKNGVDWSLYQPGVKLQPDYSNQQGYAWYAPGGNTAASFQATTGTGDPGAAFAAGGYVIYPNKANTNMIQRVYTK